VVSFDFTERPVEHTLADFVEAFVQTQSEQGGDFISEAATHWEMIIVRGDQKPYLMIRGSETHATLGDCPANSEFTIIRFRVGTFMPHLPMERLVDQEIITENAGKNSFWLNGAVYQYPNFENIEAFVDKLIENGAVAKDTTVAEALSNNELPITKRHLQRRFRTSTGMSQNKIQQINRVEKVARALMDGETIADATHLGEYADQSHLTRSLKYYLGQTPAQFAARS